MKKFLLVISTIFAVSAFGQVRTTKLVIKFKEVYELGSSDILVADTLVLMDSAKLVLNKLKKENYIRAQVAIFGKGSVIDGSGAPGKTGRRGKDGESPYLPCSNGSDGQAGGRGLDGASGISLFLYADDIIIKGKVLINLSGGKGGDGGDGGNGGGGSKGTTQCDGGNGGNGGSGGNAGNGGNGGALFFSCKRCPHSANLVKNQVNLSINGGYYGNGGRGGDNGLAGIGVARRTKSGLLGKFGLDAETGRSGNVGSLKFEEN